MIEVNAISKRLGTTQAVKGVSFSVADGTIIGLIGPNGAGKTTTLRMMAGVLRPDEGQIRIGSHDPHADGGEARRTMGALLDHTGLYERLTAREHLTFFGRLRHLSPQELSARIEHVAESLGLKKFIDRRAAGFSQGERMKLALGCSMIHDPRHLLLDEPTNGLDPNATVDFREHLKRLRDRGMAIIFSSHVLSEVHELCHRVVVLANGRVAQQGSLDEICAATGTNTLELAFMKLTRAEG